MDRERHSDRQGWMDGLIEERDGRKGKGRQRWMKGGLRDRGIDRKREGWTE